MYRTEIEAIVQQELSCILLQTIKVAEKDGKLELEDVLKLVLRVVASRIEKREGASF